MSQRVARWMSIFGVFAASAGCEDPVRSRFTLVNHGPGRLDSVVVLTRGHQQLLGDVPAGESRSARVRAEGESGFEIEFGRAERRRLSAGGYFEGAYRGTYTVEVREERLTAVRDGSKP